MKTLMLYTQEAAGVPREGEPVTCGLPFPSGELHDPTQIRLCDAQGQVFPCVARPLFSWPDGSIRWLLVDAQVSVAPMARASWTLQYGDGAVASPPEEAITWRTSGQDSLLLSTGALDLLVGRRGTTIIRQATMSDRWHALAEAGLSLEATDADGRSYRGVVRDACVEEANALRAVVRCDGGYLGDGDERLLGFQLRIYLYAGRSDLRLYHTFVHDTPAPVAEIRSLSMHVAPALGGSPRAYLGARSDWFGVGYDTGEVAEAVEVFQPLVERHVLRRASGQRQVQRTNSFGWVTLQDDAYGVTLKLRHPWQNYPMACRADRTTLSLDLVPRCEPGDLVDTEPATGMSWVELRQQGAPAPTGVLRVPQGMAKTHEIMLRLGPAAGSLATADAPCIAFEMPLLVRADSAWYTASGALGEMAPYLSDYWPLEQRLRSFCTAPNGLGVLNYGDTVTTADVPGPDGVTRTVTRTTENAAYDVSRSILREHLRTGHQPYFWWGEASVMHLMDVDTVHHSERHPEWVGGPHMQWAQNHHFRDTDEREQMPPVTSHTWIGGILDYYCLTGYRRAWEIATRCAEFCRRRAPLQWAVPAETLRQVHDPAQPWPYCTRVAGWPLLAMGQVHALEPRPELLAAMASLVRLFAQWQDAEGRWREQVGSFNRGSTPFMVASALQGLQAYVEITGDEAAADVLYRAARFVATSATTPEGLFFYKEAPISANAHASSLMLVGPLAYVFERTGDVAVLDAAYRFFRWMVDERLVSTYLLKDLFAAMLLFERLGLLDPYRGTDIAAHLASRAHPTEGVR